MPFYTKSIDGLTISNKNIIYKFNSISNSTIIGNRIGKGNYMGDKFYVYERKGKDKQNDIIVNSSDLEVFSEYKAIKKPQ